MKNILDFLRELNAMTRKQKSIFLNSFVDAKDKDKIKYLAELSEIMPEEELLYRWQK